MMGIAKGDSFQIWPFVVSMLDFWVYIFISLGGLFEKIWDDIISTSILVPDVEEVKIKGVQSFEQLVVCFQHVQYFQF